MDITVNLTKIEAMDQLIRLKQTGSPKVFAEKLNISEATLYNYLKMLKSFDIPIKYDFIYQTYFYTKEGRIAFHFTESLS